MFVSQSLSSTSLAAAFSSSVHSLIDSISHSPSSSVVSGFPARIFFLMLIFPSLEAFIVTSITQNLQPTMKANDQAGHHVDFLNSIPCPSYSLTTPAPATQAD